MSSSQGRLQSVYRLLDSVCTPLGQLVARLVFGQAFLITGWGKLHNLDNFVKFFTDLGIPAPHIQAPFVATVEFVGGILLLLGLGTRITSLFLASTMVVALLTAHRADFAPAFTLDKSLADITPLPFLAALLWLMAKGGGSISVDRLLASRSGGGSSGK